MSAKKRLRCAIYTRKSGEEGLDQAFNSLDAQRESCEAYIKSQSHEGWTALPQHYDDGGYSGGSMDRPRLQSLLADIAAGKIDTIVCYKVDRLTRSLADFAKMVEILDRHGVSFVSVTQQFNTTTSMGRLTLNVLLSFAQFEREVTGERIRDKIAASKKKGMWMGGRPPLGYDAVDRRLVINRAEADQVRGIYTRYLALGSVKDLVHELHAEGVRSKRWLTRDGRRMGGGELCRGAVYHLLKNRLYLGEIAHRGNIYPGEHGAIVDRSIWDQVQAMLAQNAATEAGAVHAASGAILCGLLFDDEGHPMSPVFTKKPGGKRYRYYVSQALMNGHPKQAGTLPRVPANAIERVVLDGVKRRCPGPNQNDMTLLKAKLQTAVHRVELSRDTVTMVLQKSAIVTPAHGAPADVSSIEDDQTISMRIPIALGSQRGSTVIESGPSQLRAQPRQDHALIKALARAHQWKHALMTGAASSLDDLAALSGCPDRYVRYVLNLAFLSPELVEAILDGRQPSGFTVMALMAKPPPLSWRDQRQHFF